MKFILLDASIIIEAHKLKVWQAITGSYKIVVVSSVSVEASFVPDNKLYKKNYIDLESEFKNNRITKIAIPFDDIQNIIKKVQKNMIEEIHPGEAESIAVLLDPRYNDFFFCTSDKPAVFAAYLLSVGDRVVSFETCLKRAVKRNLSYQYTEEAMKKWKAEAIQRFGLDAVGKR